MGILDTPGITPRANAVTVGATSLGADGDLVIDVTTPWGIDPVSGPYWDPGGVTAGQEALFRIESDGTASWLLISEVA